MRPVQRRSGFGINHVPSFGVRTYRRDYVMVLKVHFKVLLARDALERHLKRSLTFTSLLFIQALAHGTRTNVKLLLILIV